MNFRNVLSLSLLVTIAGTGCTKSGSLSEDPVAHTGSFESESQFGAYAKSSIDLKSEVYVSSQQLKLRHSPEVTDNELGLLYMNDRVIPLSNEVIGDDKFVRARVVSTNDPDLMNRIGYVSAKYLGPRPVEQLSEMSPATKDNFVIVNVATEMVRLYRKCQPDEGCRNRMLMEFRGTVGDDSDKMRSDVGVYQTISWSKFYETGPYAGYYRESYPELPPKGARGEWLGKARPPGKSGPRGAFGWYTVKIGPEANGQWMHGTIGWGADKEKFVRFQDSFFGAITSIFAQLGSHGCTRLSNEAIAYLRTQLPVGAPFIKIYANEVVSGRPDLHYPSSETLGRFDYILTKLGAGEINSRHDLPSREAVLRRGTPHSDWMEEGTFFYDQTPTARKGDHYGLGQKKFAGAFIVDEGLITPAYRHPVDQRLHIGGFKTGFPDFVRIDIGLN